MKKFEAVLFDIDGTLLDTTELLFRSFEHTLATHKIPVKSRDEIGRLIGMYVAEIYKKLAPGINPNALIETHFTFQAQNLHLATIFPNTKTVLETLQNAGVKLAAISNRIRTSRQSLKLAGISEYFDVIITAEDITNPKPHPEIIEKALIYLGVKPKKAAIVGDTESDILTGKNARVTTIGVTYGFHGQRLAESKPDFLVHDISEILPIILD